MTEENQNSLSPELRKRMDELFSWLPSTRKHLDQAAKRGLNVDIGEYVYGQPKVFFQGDAGRKLRIGNFTSIGPDVKIYVGRQGRHPLDFLSTFPMAMLAGGVSPNIRDRSRAFQGDLNVDIGPDVWLGVNSVILAGVTIGPGAVIGAGAVVTRDVRPYSVVGGIPAKELKRRFDDDAINELLELRWWELPLGLLVENIEPLFFESDVKLIIERLRKLSI